MHKYSTYDMTVKVILFSHTGQYFQLATSLGKIQD